MSDRDPSSGAARPAPAPSRLKVDRAWKAKADADTGKQPEPAPAVMYVVAGGQGAVRVSFDQAEAETLAEQAGAAVGAVPVVADYRA